MIKNEQVVENKEEKIESLTNKINKVKWDLANLNESDSTTLLTNKTKLSNSLTYLEMDLLRLTNKEYAEKYNNALWSESAPRG
jgi:hypothetical protein